MGSERPTATQLHGAEPLSLILADLVDIDEVTMAEQPTDWDTDQDNCSNAKELGTAAGPASAATAREGAEPT